MRLRSFRNAYAEVKYSKEDLPDDYWHQLALKILMDIKDS